MFMSPEFLAQALGLVAVGMAMVFAVLAALTAAVVVMSRLMHAGRRDPQPGEVIAAPDAQAEMAAAVAAAIRHHRARTAVGASTGS